MRRLWTSLIITLLILTACNGGGDAAPTSVDIDADGLLDEVVDNIRATSFFRMRLEQRGAPYEFLLPIGEGGAEVNIVLRNADAQFVSPDVLYASANVVIGRLPGVVLIFAREDNQWFRVPPLPWLNQPFAEAFNPLHLISTDSGFQAALSTLTDLEFIGEETLDTGENVLHLRGTASGPRVSDLLMGFVQTEADVRIDVYINPETHLPAALQITQPNRIAEGYDEPTNWYIEFYDYNGEPDIEDPES